MPIGNYGWLKMNISKICMHSKVTWMEIIQWASQSNILFLLFWPWHRRCSRSCARLSHFIDIIQSNHGAQKAERKFWKKLNECKKKNWTGNYLDILIQEMEQRINVKNVTWGFHSKGGNTRRGEGNWMFQTGCALLW